MTRPLLPLADAAPAERADAARNREALLREAVRMVAEGGTSSLTMECLAHRAGVGKGTVFRRFGSREGLMAQVLDLSERDWQASVLGGEPPLGPGAPPWERLVAFGESRLRTTLLHADLIRAAGDATGSRSVAASSFMALHVGHLLGELGVAGDLPLLATALLAPLEVPVLVQQVDREHLPVERVVAAWVDLAGRVVSARADAGRR
ncbi:TetR/AcrR family transcriptional regulator [Nocardioides bruguierae]|uniref:TetR/AcrR family transcriptional regulator n=1 Tax=Nocardioides bruguierae TaxID=2945102 RepID=A0A9X2D618_9ACTN|nr:helix-turn-helix domain-containing protein [Nocardioides bruguierae]MCM0619715.1 TetR/AcrR family transcriptional regulator [Nocardioides bruguierae]